MTRKGATAELETADEAPPYAAEGARAIRAWKASFAADRLDARLRTEEAWQATARALQDEERDRTERLDAIHRDIRLVGDMLIAFCARLEALEEARTPQSVREVPDGESGVYEPPQALTEDGYEDDGVYEDA